MEKLARGNENSAAVSQLLNGADASAAFEGFQRTLKKSYNPLILQRVEYFDKSSPVHKVFAGTYASA